MSKLSNFVLFSAGVAAGVTFSWYYFKEKYERFANEEIKSVKEVFLQEKTNEPSKQVESKKTANQKQSYNKIVNDEGYTNYSKKRKDDLKMPYVISPENFGEFDEYEKVSLTYYSDNVLTDEDDNVIEDPDELIGPDSLSCFGEYEDDSVFVRDDERKCDYEILLDNRRFSSVIKTRPKPVIDE